MMINEVEFPLDSVKKIVIFAYETGYCDGIEDKYPKMKDYKDAEDYWIKNKESFIKRFAKQK